MARIIAEKVQLDLSACETKSPQRKSRAVSRSHLDLVSIPRSELSMGKKRGKRPLFPHPFVYLNQEFPQDLRIL
jgi:hypothetical protein